jgi:hypothetical protein
LALRALAVPFARAGAGAVAVWLGRGLPGLPCWRNNSLIMPAAPEGTVVTGAGFLPGTAAGFETVLSGRLAGVAADLPMVGDAAVGVLVVAGRAVPDFVRAVDPAFAGAVTAAAPAARGLRVIAAVAPLAACGAGLGLAGAGAALATDPVAPAFGRAGTRGVVAGPGGVTRAAVVVAPPLGARAGAGAATVAAGLRVARRRAAGLSAADPAGAAGAVDTASDDAVRAAAAVFRGAGASSAGVVDDAADVGAGAGGAAGGVVFRARSAAALPAPSSRTFANAPGASSITRRARSPGVLAGTLPPEKAEIQVFQSFHQDPSCRSALVSQSGAASGIALLVQ